MTLAQGQGRPGLVLGGRLKVLYYNIAASCECLSVAIQTGLNEPRAWMALCQNGNSGGRYARSNIATDCTLCHLGTLARAAPLKLFALYALPDYAHDPHALPSGWRGSKYTRQFVG